MMIPKNGWFMMESPTKIWMINGVPPFWRKPPYIETWIWQALGMTYQMDFQWFPHPHPIAPSSPMDFRNTSGDTSGPPMVERRSSHFEAPRRGKSSGNFRRENHDETTGISDKALYYYIYISILCTSNQTLESQVPFTSFKSFKWGYLPNQRLSEHQS
jgi:hypothetical protein